jgi:hypothetical protein
MSRDWESSPESPEMKEECKPLKPDFQSKFP